MSECVCMYVCAETLKNCTHISPARPGGDCAPESVAIVRTMELAGQTKIPRILCLAIDSLHKMMSFGFVNGWMPLAPNGSSRALSQSLSLPLFLLRLFRHICVVLFLV